MRILLKLLCLFVAGTVLLTLGGCWSAVELNDRVFARIMLLDQTDKGIEVTLGFPLPNRLAGQSGSAGGGGGDSGSEPFTFVTKTAPTVGDAYRQIQADLPRTITFGQLRNVVIGRSYAETGLETFVDFVARVPKIHINANLFVTEGKVEQFMKLPLVFERFPTDILTRYAKDRVTVTVTVKDLIMALYHGGDFIAPLLVFGREGAEQDKNGEKWMGTDGAALMREGRLAGTLNSMETRGAMWIMGELKDAEFDVPSPTDGKNISFIVDRTTTKVKPAVKGNQIRIRILCQGKARIIMTNSNVDLSNAVQLRRVERVLEEALEERISGAVAQSKRANTDAFQFGQFVEWRYPRKWRSIASDWRQTFVEEVEVDPVVDIRVKWFGSVRKPVWNRFSTEREGSK